MANAPHEIRDFAFVLSKKDYTRLFNDLSHYTEPENFLEELRALAVGKGRLTITKMRRTQKDGKPLLEWMDFKVVLTWPDR